MTGDRLRKLADEATPGPWGYVGWDLAHHFKGVPTNTAIGQTFGEPDARLIAALGPDAARLLADAMDATDDPDLLARFAALGEPS